MRENLKEITVLLLVLTPLAGVFFLVGCDGGTVTSGGQRQALPEEILLLHPEDQRYVRHYIKGVGVHPFTSSDIEGKRILLGPDWENRDSMNRAGVLVHEACHIENLHQNCLDAQEELCNARAALAMERIGEDTAYWDRPSHCI